MPVVPAYCPSCDAIFTPKGALTIGVLESNLNMPGGTTDCAHCAGEAVILDAVFDLIADSTRHLIDVDCTAEELEKLAALLGEARRRRLSRDRAVAEIQAAVPRLRDLVGDFLPTKPERCCAVYSLLLYLLFDLLAQDHQREIHIDVNITPYLTVLIDKMVADRPWSFAGPSR